jgi:hypothetical protein
MVTFFSCSKDFYGTYNTNYSKDKSAFFQIKLNADNTVEKTEIHTISDFAKGKFLMTHNRKIVCFFDSSSSKFPLDTVTFKLKEKKLYFIKDGILNKTAYLIKQQ